ncbi:hypothetical protein FisN_17Lh150 [Fistulifera solaris]|uniref:Pentacotripeptide-repeat region of PRORP domain-containing protein n=1 Tax=Fistulifera solaris TaxID=1519565 RepID=A0A1Z5K8W0_FISSO|nr:hypothetical protein FisN_17Lh150 [Fistulifera solaris]|eukprot:GAX22657.1 hypothetical protein FisN_17Lh150 [Fistulifera solaris]
MKETSVISSRHEIGGEPYHTALVTMNRDLDPREDDKENRSRQNGKRLHHKHRRSPSSALEEDSLTSSLSLHENGNFAVASAKISLSPLLRVDRTKTGILTENQKENVPFLDPKQPKMTISDTSSSFTNINTQIKDGAFTILGVGSNDMTEGIFDDKTNKEADALSAPTTQLRRSRRLRKRPSRFDAEFDGLGSLPKPEARGKRSDDENDNEDPPTPATIQELEDKQKPHAQLSVQELEVLLSKNFTPLPFCDPLSSIYSFGAIGDRKQGSHCHDSDKSVSLADVFCPEGVFSSVKLLSQFDLKLDEDREDSKASKHADLSDTVYQGQKIADMKLPAYCRMLKNIAHNSESPDQAQNILRVTIQQYLDCIGTLRPNGACFNAVIHGYAQLGYAAAAENVLSLMFQDYFNYHNTLAKPNVRVYTNVLHAWRKSNSPDAHERCENLLEEMHRLSDTGVAPECKPDAYAYTVLFHCLAESDCADGSEVAERQYVKMKQGAKMLQVDAIAYSNLLNIFTKNPSTHKRAEQLLWEMVSDYKGGNKKAKPHTRNFNTVLAMWAKSNDPESARRAQLVVERLIQFQDEGTLHVKPDEYTYSLLLKNW